MDEKKVIFKRLKDIKNHWRDAALKGLENNSNLIWSDNPEKYALLQKSLQTAEDKDAFSKVIDEIIRGSIHSILVMLDGGDEVNDTVKLDLINEKNGKTINDNRALHEEFYEYLIDEGLL